MMRPAVVILKLFSTSEVRRVVARWLASKVAAWLASRTRLARNSAPPGVWKATSFSATVCAGATARDLAAFLSGWRIELRLFLMTRLIPSQNETFFTPKPADCFFIAHPHSQDAKIEG